MYSNCLGLSTQYMMQSLHTGRWEGRDVQRRKKKQCALPPCWRIGTGRCCRRRAHEMACLQFRVRALFLFPLVQLNCAECVTERKLSPISFVQMGASAPASCQFKNFFCHLYFFHHLWWYCTSVSLSYRHDQTDGKRSLSTLLRFHRSILRGTATIFQNNVCRYVA